MHKKANHLQGQNSPYLLQHLYNPVDWHPWGEEALGKAKRENKPLLVSIGYSACHWCHVMEQESFEDPEVSAIMNKYFVCIKVDREERPDLDHFYMNAVQLISGRGGWPLNCFALPDGRPFWGATYFPKDQWTSILQRIAELFKNQPSDLEKQAQELTKGVSNSSILLKSDNAMNFPEEISHKMATALVDNTDPKEGGTQGSPKFPLPVVYEFLLHYFKQTGEVKAIEAVHLTLHKMAMGGIYDQIGGGFARYATDERWKIPHFEKMLYDNAQLISLYSKAWQVQPHMLYKEVVLDSIEFINRELTSAEGTFYSALDADSQGEEGRYYVWKEKEFNEILGDEAPLAREYFNVGGKGFWEKGNNILVRNASDDAFAHEHDIQTDVLKKKTQEWKHKLLKSRKQRIKPGLDNKVLVSWNALMISGLVHAYQAFDEPVLLERAEKAARFIEQHAIEPDGKIYHTLVIDKPYIDGFLEDYSGMIQALINLYQVTLDEDLLWIAHNLTQYVMTNFSSSKTHLFSFSSQKGEKLAAPFYEFQDNVIPASNSVMARCLFYLGNFYENPIWVKRSRQMLIDMKPQMEKYGGWAANWGILWLHHQKEFYTLALCGEKAMNIARELGKHYLPDCLIAGTSDGKTRIPLLENRFVKNENLIYPCTLESCKQPVNDTQELLEMIKEP